MTLMNLNPKITVLSFSLFIASNSFASTSQWPGTEQATVVAPTSPSAPTVSQSEFTAYIGMGVDLLPAAVIAQMPKGISTGEGIMITRFTPNSPAEKSDIRAYDILLAYDNHKIIHPTQFITLVRNDQPGRTVQLKLIRNGQTITRAVTLASQKRPVAPSGLSIKQQGKNSYIASIRFKDATGKPQLRQYKGTRQQIYYQALNATDLPQADKAQIRKQAIFSFA